MSDWELFNLTPHDCTKEDLKKAFTRLAFANHPDLGGDEKKFIEVKSAYDRLLAVIDPSTIKNSDAELVIQEFMKELIERYNQAFPWRPVIKDTAIAESVDWSKEYLRQNKYVKKYMEELARKELSNLNRLHLDSPMKIIHG